MFDQLEEKVIEFSRLSKIFVQNAYQDFINVL